MAPFSGKRARAQAAAAEAKKPRTVDPIVEKMEIISKTISEPECQLQDSHREMLLRAIPHVLSVTCDERHEYQTRVAQMVEKVLNDYLAQKETEVAESKENISASSQKATDAMRVVEDSAGKISDQEEEVKRSKEVVHEDSDAVKGAEEAFKNASKEVAEFDEKMKETIAQKDQCSSVYNESFITLKTGGIDGKEVTRLVKPVQDMLKKLSTEPSLLSAIAPAFKKASADRGQFDTMAIEGAENIFTNHLAELTDQINKADETKAEKTAAEETAQNALTAAKEKCLASEAAQKTAQDELASLEAKHVELLEALNAADAASSVSESIVSAKEGEYASVQLALSSFTELFERQNTVPEPAADTIAQEKLDAVCESSAMELTTAA